MSWLPGWNSIDGTSTIHDFFEIAGIVFLGLLVVAEVIAYAYGHRHSELVVEHDKTSSAERQQADIDKDKRHAAEAEKFRNELMSAQKASEEANNRAANLEGRVASRTLSVPEKNTILDVLAQFPGEQISIWVPMGASEAISYALEFVALFRQANWKGVENYGLNQALWSGQPPVGLTVFVSKKDVDSNSIPASAIFFWSRFNN
ncbi:hypothetical protein [Hydrocarboniphaga sp.]|uniref:hypothetical protein n=1 Tax=Hydrocarboniphaga sp. TaxID=2033016 RepID=UPI002ABBEB34|nr:hypothetical protein [Hydrocarboniphaga sp.]MDZ4077532.1 hypothetical protein [Hydrocarboniphaga sp.]